MLSCGGGLKTCLLNHLLMSPFYTDHPTIYIANSLFQAGYMANLLMSLVSLDQLANMTWVLYISLYLDLRDMLCRHANSRMSPIYLLSRAVVQVGCKAAARASHFDLCDSIWRQILFLTSANCEQPASVWAHYNANHLHGKVTRTERWNHAARCSPFQFELVNAATRDVHWNELFGVLQQTLRNGEGALVHCIAGRHRTILARPATGSRLSPVRACFQMAPASFWL